MKGSIHFIVVALGAFALAATATAQDIHMNELFVSHTGTDDKEFIELIGTPDMSLDFLMVLVVEGDSTNAGILDRAWALTGYAMPSDGYFVLGDTAVVTLDYDLGSDNNIENGTETFYLVDATDQAGVDAITALLGTNIDAGGGATLIPSMATIIDIIAMIDDDYPTTDFIYDGADYRGPDGTYFPPGIFRGLDYPNDWSTAFLDFDDDANLNRPTTAGGPNPPVSFADITANGSDDAVTINYGDTLTIDITLDPADDLGLNADYWLLASSPFGWYRYNVVSGAWVPGFATTYQGTLNAIGPMTVYSGTTLPVGTYTFYFGVDMNMNGSLDMGVMSHDRVSVTVM